MERNQPILLVVLDVQGEIFLFKGLMKAMGKNSPSCKILQQILKIKSLYKANHTSEEKIKDVFGRKTALPFSTEDLRQRGVLILDYSPC